MRAANKRFEMHKELVDDAQRWAPIPVASRGPTPPGPARRTESRVAQCMWPIIQTRSVPAAKIAEGQGTSLKLCTAAAHPHWGFFAYFLLGFKNPSRTSWEILRLN